MPSVLNECMEVHISGYINLVNIWLTLLTGNILNVLLQQKLQGNLEASVFALNEIRQHGNFSSGLRETINSDTIVFLVGLSFQIRSKQKILQYHTWTSLLVQ